MRPIEHPMGCPPPSPLRYGGGVMAYHQLFTAMQGQCMMAGLPFKLLDVEDLVNMTALLDVDVILCPVCTHVHKDLYPAVKVRGAGAGGTQGPCSAAE